MKVKVRYTMSAQWTAEVEYEELADAWASDAEEHGSAEEPYPALPSEEQLREKGVIAIGRESDEWVDDLLLAAGRQGDTQFAYVTEIEAAQRDA